MNFHLINMVKLLVFLLINIMIVLPGGEIGGFNIKIFIILMYCIFMIFIFLKDNVVYRKTLYLILSLISSLILCCFFYINSSVIAQKFGYTKMEGSSFVNFFLSLYLIFIGFSQKVFDKIFFIKCVFSGVIIYSCIKILLIIFSFLNILDINLVAAFIVSYFNAAVMVLPITDNLSRFLMANDYIVVFFLFFYLIYPQKINFVSGNFRKILILILLVSVFISFSRYMFILIFLGFIISLYFNFNLSVRWILSFLLLCLMVIFLYFNFSQSINEFIELRFNSDVSDGSDINRVVQYTCLTNLIPENFLLGYGGFGDFNSTCSTNPETKYGYELQYLGFFYKFGLIGTILIMWFYLMPYFIMIGRKIFINKNFIPNFSLIMWLIVGLSNPYLISSYAAVVLLLCYSFYFQE